MDYSFCNPDLEKDAKCESCEREADHVLVLVERHRGCRADLDRDRRERGGFISGVRRANDDLWCIQLIGQRGKMRPNVGQHCCGRSGEL